MVAHRRARLKRWLGLIALVLGASNAYSTTASGCFDDEKLRQLIAAEGRGTLVYIWSPRMVYSVQQMAQAARAAALHGMDFLPLHDARVPAAEIKPLLNFPSRQPPTMPSVHEMLEQDLETPPFFPIDHNSLPLCAQALLSNEATRHFPTAFVVTQQGVHRHPIVGAMPANAWLQSISQRLQQP